MPRTGAALKAEALRRCGGWHAPIGELLRNTDEAHITGYPAYDRAVWSEMREGSRRRDGSDPVGQSVWLDESDGDEQRKRGRSLTKRQLSPRWREASQADAHSAQPPTLLPASIAVTLLGDAAHPMSPFKGQGANQALLDAVSLARALRRAELFGGTAPLCEALKQYEDEMLARSASKVVASRAAAECLHSASATSSSNCTRAAAARAAENTLGFLNGHVNLS